MNQYDDEMLIEEILCCQTEEDIQSLVDSQCLDIIGTSLLDQVKLAHKQLFRMIRLFKRELQNRPKGYKDNLYEIQEKMNKLEFEKTLLLETIKLYEADNIVIRNTSFEQLKQIEEQLQHTLQKISQHKNTLIQSKLCVICLQKPYCMIIKPCGHICICEECSIRVTKCPIDRERIKKIKKIFLS